MTKLCAILLLLIPPSNTLPQNSCTCKKAGADEYTYGSSVLWPLAEQRVKKIRGQVFMAVITPFHPVEGALVEVFTDPNPVAELAFYNPERMKRQKRVAACKTDENGEFCFTGLRPGRYELRVSKEGISIASGVVILNPKNRKSSDERIKVPAQDSI